MIAFLSSYSWNTDISGVVEAITFALVWSSQSPFFVLMGRISTCPTLTAFLQPLLIPCLHFSPSVSFLHIGGGECWAWKCSHNTLGIEKLKRPVQHPRPLHLTPGVMAEGNNGLVIVACWLHSVHYGARLWYSWRDLSGLCWCMRPNLMHCCCATILNYTAWLDKENLVSWACQHPFTPHPHQPVFYGNLGVQV